MNYIETERLLLRDWREEDLPFFVEMNQDPRVMEYFPGPLTESETLAFYELIQKEFAEWGYGLGILCEVMYFTRRACKSKSSPEPN